MVCARTQPAACTAKRTHENHLVTAGRVTFYTSSLAFSVLDPLGHQRHLYRLRVRALINPYLNTDIALRRSGFGKTVIDFGLQRAQW